MYTPGDQFRDSGKKIQWRTETSKPRRRPCLLARKREDELRCSARRLRLVAREFRSRSTTGVDSVLEPPPSPTVPVLSINVTEPNTIDVVPARLLAANDRRPRWGSAVAEAHLGSHAVAATGRSPRERLSIFFRCIPIIGLYQNLGPPKIMGPVRPHSPHSYGPGPVYMVIHAHL
jgi:hypothetical protein